MITWAGAGSLCERSLQVSRVFETSRAENFSFCSLHPAERCCMQVAVPAAFVIVTSFSVCRVSVTESRTGLTHSHTLGVCVEGRDPAVCYLTSTLIFHIEFMHFSSVSVRIKKAIKSHWYFSLCFRAGQCQSCHSEEVNALQNKSKQHENFCH